MSKLREMLLQVQQDAEFHPEGNVWTHTRAVRKSLDEAITLLPEFCIDTPGNNILRLSAWCHDLGKSQATIFRQGRWIAPEHEKPKYLNAALRQLGQPWQSIWRGASTDDRKAFLYLCTRHMAVSDRHGISSGILRRLRSNDPQQSRRAKLVIVLMVMDRLGTTRPSRVADAMIIGDFLRSSYIGTL